MKNFRSLEDFAAEFGADFGDEQENWRFGCGCHNLEPYSAHGVNSLSIIYWDLCC